MCVGKCCSFCHSEHALSTQFKIFLAVIAIMELINIAFTGLLMIIDIKYFPVFIIIITFDFLFTILVVVGIWAAITRNPKILLGFCITAIILILLTLGGWILIVVYTSIVPLEIAVIATSYASRLWGFILILFWIWVIVLGFRLRCMVLAKP